MPRTKVARKTATATVQEPDDNEIKLRAVLQNVQNKKKEVLARLAEEKIKMLSELTNLIKEAESSISYKHLNMTIRDIIESDSLERTGSVTCISKEDILNITKSVKKSRKTVKRSASFVDDEGYLTAESLHSGGRKSRNKTKAPQPSRKTRSLSRSNLLKVPTSSAYKTPANKVIPPNTYGVVTPKCNPNTPQVLLRRPKNGEVALSMQGSPLYTASVVTENMANINIPLLDGRLLTLQPQRGLRISQIPTFDPETLRQLETLRENLSRVCAVSSMSCKDK